MSRPGEKQELKLPSLKLPADLRTVLNQMVDEKSPDTLEKLKTTALHSLKSTFDKPDEQGRFGLHILLLQKLYYQNSQYTVGVSPEAKQLLNEFLESCHPNPFLEPIFLAEMIYSKSFAVVLHILKQAPKPEEIQDLKLASLIMPYSGALYPGPYNYFDFKKNNVLESTDSERLAVYGYLLQYKVIIDTGKIFSPHRNRLLALGCFLKAVQNGGSEYWENIKQILEDTNLIHHISDGVRFVERAKNVSKADFPEQASVSGEYFFTDDFYRQLFGSLAKSLNEVHQHSAYSYIKGKSINEEKAGELSSRNRIKQLQHYVASASSDKKEEKNSSNQARLALEKGLEDLSKQEVLLSESSALSDLYQSIAKNISLLGLTQTGIDFLGAIHKSIKDRLEQSPETRNVTEIYKNLVSLSSMQATNQSNTSSSSSSSGSMVSSISTPTFG